MQQLLWIETILKLAAGVLLLTAPLMLAGILGLQRPANGFWPRLLGALLVGLAAATFIEARLPGSRGLGLAGSLVINLVGAGVVAAELVMGSAAPSGRGRLVLWLLVLLLALLSVAEIMYA